jgi:alanine racemase
MTDPPAPIHPVPGVISVSDVVLQQIVDDWQDTRQAAAEYMALTPDERAARRAQHATERAAERARTPKVGLTLDALLDRLGFTPEYAYHLVQPYCSCDLGDEGGPCQHWLDHRKENTT